MTWLALALAALATSCALEKKEFELSELDWECEEGLDGCHCESAMGDPFDDGNPYRSSPRCSYYGCCLLDRQERDNVLATCDCFAAQTTCEQEAAARPGTEIVTQCPVGQSPSAATCALVGESCEDAYLSEKSLAGCCGDLVCVPDADGRRSCQVASDETRALKEQCVAALGSFASTELFPTLSTVRTSLGTFEFGHVALASAGMGPQGCLNGFSVTLEGSTADCSLRLSVDTSAGKLIVSFLSADLAGCTGFTGSADFRLTAVSRPPFTFAHEGQACTASSGSSDEYCYAGSFDFHLGGTVSSGGRHLTFEEQTIRLQGAVCSYPFGQCPAP